MWFYFVFTSWLMIIKYIIRCLLAIYIFSLWTYESSFVHFFIGLFDFLLFILGEHMVFLKYMHVQQSFFSHCVENYKVRYLKVKFSQWWFWCLPYVDYGICWNYFLLQTGFFATGKRRDICRKKFTLLVASKLFPF